MAGSEGGHPVKEHERQFVEIKEIQKDHEKRIKMLEEMYARQDEKQKQIFITLGEIKQLISSAMDEMKRTTLAIITPIQNDVEKLKGKPGTTLDKVKYAIITAIISGIVGLIIGLISTKAGG